MKPGARKLLLTVHIAASVGWLGGIVAYIPLDLATVLTDDAATLRAAYVAMDLVARWALAPLAITALATGVAVALTTRWGLFQHYWVAISLVLTTLAALVLLVELPTISALAARAADPSTSAEALRALPSTLPHSVGGFVVLTFVLVLNMYKPRGVTRRGWRKQQEARGSGEQR